MDEKELAERLLRIDLLKRALKAEETKLRDAGVEWKPGTRVVGTYRGQDLGTVSRTTDQVTWHVSDYESLFLWALERHPEKIVHIPESRTVETVVKPAETILDPVWVKELLQAAEDMDGGVDPSTGDVLPYITKSVKQGHLMASPTAEMKKMITEGLGMIDRLEIQS